jgi:creatine kinase/arginine kinase
MIISTRIRVGRNLKDYPLGPQITDAQRLEMEGKISQQLLTFDGDLQGSYFPLNNLTEDQKKSLIEDHFLFKQGDRFLEACGLNRDWPNGRGIFHNVDKTFLVWVNEEDELRIISMQPGADIKAVFDRLCRACNIITQKIPFAYDEQLGYITSCPTNLGTALRASVHIKLPKLGVQKEEFQKIADHYNVQIRGIHGEHSESNDHVYDISNKRRLGRSTVDLVQDMYNGVKAMIEKEKTLK